MDPFMQKNFTVEKISTVCFVKAGTHQPVHINRKYSGLAMVCDKRCDFLFQDGPSVTVGRNDIIYLPQGSSYVVKSNDPGDCYAINFRSSTPFLEAPFLFHAGETSQLPEAFRRAEVTWRAKKEGYRLRCFSILYGILCDLRETCASYLPSSRQAVILPAVDYIHEHYTSEPLSVAALAAMCGITPEYFRSIFRQVRGTSPVKYINRLKLSRAEELLRSNLHSVTEVALMSGYNDLAHFSREFKKAYKISPSAYSKSSAEP